MKISKIYIVIVIVALIVAIPLAGILAKRDGQLKLERSQKQQLQIQLQKKDTQTEQQKQEIEKLKADLQAKAEIKRKQEIAKAEEAERARQASVATSAGGATYRGAGNCEAYRGIVAQYAWNVTVAMAVMQAESGCNPQAANWTDSHSTCRGSFGLFQIACFDGQVYDPAQNIAIAYQKYAARGWQPWGVCTSGKVNCY